MASDPVSRPTVTDELRDAREAVAKLRYNNAIVFGESPSEEGTPQHYRDWGIQHGFTEALVAIDKLIVDRVAAPAPDRDEIRRAALLEAAAAIRNEDWWGADDGDEYEAGDNDGKIRCIDLIETLAGVGGIAAEPQPEGEDNPYAPCKSCGGDGYSRVLPNALCLRCNGSGNDVGAGAVPQDREAGQ